MNSITKPEINALDSVCQCTYSKLKEYPQIIFDSNQGDKTPLFEGRLLVAFAMDAAETRCDGNINQHLFEKLPVAKARKVFVEGLKRFERQNKIDLQIKTPSYKDFDLAIAFVAVSHDESLMADKELLTMLKAGSELAEVEEFKNTAYSILDAQDFSLSNELQPLNNPSFSGYFSKDFSLLSEGVFVVSGQEILPWIKLCRNMCEIPMGLTGPVELSKLLWTEKGAFGAKIEKGFDRNGEQAVFQFDPKLDRVFKTLSGLSQTFSFQFLHTAMIDKHMLYLDLDDKKQKAVESAGGKQDLLTDELLDLLGQRKRVGLF